VGSTDHGGGLATCKEVGTGNRGHGPLGHEVCLGHGHGNSDGGGYCVKDLSEAKGDGSLACVDRPEDVEMDVSVAAREAK
jgi:hypothetical protein